MEFSLPASDIARLVDEQARTLSPGQRFVRGVYSGGTLAWEAVTLLRERLDDVAPDVLGAEGKAHRVVDLGEDVFTVGRPHPMIDGTVRRERILSEAAEPATAVLLLDVVLGYGTHPDPAGELVPALAGARQAAAGGGRGLAIVASVTGTERDPQVRSVQVAALAEASEPIVWSETTPDRSSVAEPLIVRVNVPPVMPAPNVIVWTAFIDAS